MSALLPRLFTNCVAMNRILLCCILLILYNTSFSQAKDTAAAMQQVQSAFEQGNGVQQILTDKRWMFLHPHTAFRQLMKERAHAAELTIAADTEAGQRITIIVSVKNKNGNAIAGASVYVYQTDNRGFYAFDTTHVYGNEGDHRHARLFGYLLTGKEGSFTLHTIMPKGYPQSALPSHIHCEVTAGNGTLITELLFDDDPRLTPAMRTRSTQEGFYVAKGDKGAYTYNVIMR